MATAQSASFGRTGWLGTVAVDPACQNRRIGATISAAAIDWLHDAGVRIILYTATDLGKTLYRRLGFDEEEVSYSIWTRAGHFHHLSSCLLCRSRSIETALLLDAAATSEDRRSCLRSFASRVRKTSDDRGAGYRIDLP